MARPTINDLAKASGVSVATVNRVLAGSAQVRKSTMERVRNAAEDINFYGVGAIQSRIAAARMRHRFGFLLHQPNRAFYQDTAKALRAASASGPTSLPGAVTNPTSTRRVRRAR